MEEDFFYKIFTPSAPIFPRPFALFFMEKGVDIAGDIHYR
jgi:hypothetical protein